jgi:anaerobic ribonucleoside-triphosphate reductase activating protein
VLAFLERRCGLLDAVVFSGGEPTLQPALPDAMRAVKTLGFKVALHTAGIHPPCLAQVLPLLDWVGMDVMAEFHRYAALTGVPGSGERARRSMELILASGVAHEFRTTVHPALLPAPALERVAALLAARGARHYVLQEFRSEGCASGSSLQDCEPGYLGSGLYRQLAPQFDCLTIRRS